MFSTWLRPGSKHKPQSSSRMPRGKVARRKHRAVPSVEQLEKLVLLSCPAFQQFREITGHCSNPNIENAGTAGIQLLRQIPARYADGHSAPSGGTRPSGRDISNRVMDQSDPSTPGSDLSIQDTRALSDFIYVFGQFLDHDMDLTRDNTGQCFDIQVAASDPIGLDDSASCPGATHVIPFRRSEFDPNTGTTNARQQLNHNDAFVDGSQIYGSDPVTADALRTHAGGRLKTDATGRFLPKKGDDAALSGIDLANDAHVVLDSQLFAVGDRRGNETVSLATMHTLFVREHNRIAAQIQSANPGMSDQDIYLRARRRVGAELQVIVYNEFLPALLGSGALPNYPGFQQNANASIKTEFSTVFFRFGHSQLDNDVERTGNNGVTIADGKLDLGRTFFDAPNVIGPNNTFDPISGKHMTDIDPLLKGPASAIAQDVDQFLVTDIRNLLFGPEGAGGEDLGARDIQRARDHAIPNFNATRQAYGLSALNSFFNDPAHGLVGITSNAALANLLSTVYAGNINNVDAFVGSICEDHVPGASVGPVTKASLVDQFRRLRDGDKFFYLNDFSGAELTDLLNTTSLAKIIQRNSNVTNLQSNVFFMSSEISGTVFVDPDGNGIRGPDEVGLGGITVNLRDDTGAVVGTTTTDAGGEYDFTNADGLTATGNYTVSLALPATFTQTAAQVSHNPGTILVSRGALDITGEDFAILGTRVNFLNGFASTAGLQLNGSTTVSGSSLRLTNGGFNQAASTFTTSPLTITGFSTFFMFRLTNANADGFTFTVQGVGPGALGSSGGGLGYGTDGSTQGPVIANSVAVKFDLFDNQGEGFDSTGVYFNGQPPTVPAVDLSNTGIDLHSGDLFEGRITYTGTTLRLQIDDDNTGAEVIVTFFGVNIQANVGSNTGFVGFTAGTGGLTATQDILQWNYTPLTSSGTGPVGGSDEGVIPVSASEGSVPRSAIVIDSLNSGLAQTSSAGGGGPAALLARAVGQGTQAQTMPDQAPVIDTHQVDAFFASTDPASQAVQTPAQSLGDSSDVAVVGGLGHEAPAAQTGIDSVMAEDLSQL